MRARKPYKKGGHKPPSQETEVLKVQSYSTCTEAVFVVPEATRAPETITTISPLLPRPDSRASSLPAT